MKSNYQIKVGVVILLAVVILLGIYWFFDKFQLYRSTYPIYAVFDNVLRLQNGADVRMAGVKIGRVEGVTLTPDSRARVDMLIQIEIKVPADSTAKVTTGAMIGDPYVEILAGRQLDSLTPASEIASLQTLTFDDMVMQADILVRKIQTTADSLNAMLSDGELQNQLKDIAKNLDNTIQQAGALLASTQSMMDENRPNLKSAMANVESATKDAAALTKRIDEMVAADAIPAVKNILEEAQRSAENLNAAIVSTYDILEGFQSTPEKVNSVLAKADTAADEASQMMANLNEVSENIKELATDKQLKEDIKTTVHNAAAASENAKETVDKLNTVLSRRLPKSRADKDVIPEYGTNLYALWNTNTNRMRVDANYTFAFNDKAFYRLGLYDVGSNAKLNLSAGKVLDERNAVRYGLFASEIGIGYDYRIGEQYLISADLYTPNRPVLDLYGITTLNGNLGLYLGAKDLFHNDKRAFIFGVRTRQ